MVAQITDQLPSMGWLKVPEAELCRDYQALPAESALDLLIPGKAQRFLLLSCYNKRLETYIIKLFVEAPGENNCHLELFARAFVAAPPDETSPICFVDAKGKIIERFDTQEVAGLLDYKSHETENKLLDLRLRKSLIRAEPIEDRASCTCERKVQNLGGGAVGLTLEKDTITCGPSCLTFHRASVPLMEKYLEDWLRRDGLGHIKVYVHPFPEEVSPG